MEVPEEPWLCGIGLLIARELLKTMEKHVNDDDVSIQTIDSGRKNEVETSSVDPAIPRPANGIQEKPSNKLEEMGTGDGGNSMPKDGPGVPRVRVAWVSQLEALNALGIKMNLAMLLAREAFQQFRKRTLRAMTAIDKG
jgi:hypothetical protein